MRKITTILTVLFTTSAFAWPISLPPTFINHVPGHTSPVPVPPKRTDAFKGWKPPLEIQNKAGTTVVPAPVKK